MIRRSDMVVLLLFTVVLSQIMEVGLPILRLSAEEPLIILATLGCLALGLSFRFSWLVLAVAAVEFAVAGLFRLAHGDLGGLILPILSVGVRFVAFSYLYDWFLREPDRFLRQLCRFWVVLALISGTLAILQTFAIPPIAVVGGEVRIMTRSIGLQHDPNYAAFSYAIAAALIRPLNWRREFAIAAQALLLVAVLATASRMGVILLLLVYAYRWSSGWSRIGGAEVIARVWIAAVALAGGLLLAGLWSNLNNVGIFHRMSQAAETLGETTLEQLSQTRGLSTDSAFERMALAYAGVQVWQDNFWIGVGPDRLQFEIWRRVRVMKATHNGFIDRLAIGGAAGVVFVVLVLFCAVVPRFLRGVRGVAAELRDIADIKILIFVLGSFFLNLSIWLPSMLLAVAMTMNARQRRAASAERAAELRRRMQAAEPAAAG